MRAQLLQALGETVQLLAKNNIAPDRPLDEIQVITRNGVRIPLNSGQEFEGVLNEIEPGPLTPQGYIGEEISGSSSSQTLTFGAAGPVAQALLTCSQSTDSASPHHADQTVLFSQKRWVTLPFSAAASAADPALTTLKFSE